MVFCEPKRAKDIRTYLGALRTLRISSDLSRRARSVLAILGRGKL
jgi:hypothetical protein